jgi:hypothetical protein
VNCAGHTIWIADAHRDNEKRFVARSDEKLTAFLELERVTRPAMSQGRKSGGSSQPAAHKSNAQPKSALESYGALGGDLV